MSSRHVTTTYFKCERCTVEIECRSDLYDEWSPDRNRWGLITTQRSNGGSVRGTSDGYKAELCKECMDTLERWLGHGGTLT